MSVNWKEIVLDYEPELEDISYLKTIMHCSNGPWQQYDIKLDARPYGWESMIYIMNELVNKDFKEVQTLTTTYVMGGNENELISEFRDCGNNVNEMKTLKREGSMLGIGGISKRIGVVKVVLINQTNILRLFTWSEDKELLARYAETLIRGTFDTENEMKLGKPCQK